MQNSQRVKTFLGRWKEFEFGTTIPVNEEESEGVYTQGFRKEWPPW